MPEFAKAVLEPTVVGAKQPIAVDDTEVSVSGTSETEVKKFTFLKSDLMPFKILIVQLEGKVSGGTGYFRIYIDGSLKKELTTTSTSYIPLVCAIDVTDLAKGSHEFSLRLLNSGSYNTYNRTIEVYGVS